ncbi:hypothetical protein [Vreelandella populi]|uniref:Uncharacterized protein n=1 Tax=Vreelandella populi TaxID=2498858 RepID=A0A433LFN8_9GAMM|nr:hypothetical protein [Halomonas populi]RUR48809.1 hypothetical protein ELY37_02865 [Halomonas populi]
MVELIIGLFVMLIGGLGVLFTQRNTARKKADDANRTAAYERAAREMEQRINTSQQKAREEAQHVQRENEQHQSAGTRPDAFGDSRLHDRQNRR